MTHTDTVQKKIVYWRRELPPLDAELIAEHTVEATSKRIPNTVAHRDELWDRCYEDLTAHAQTRLEEEVVRLGGDCAHVFDESVESRRDDITGETWLHGSYTYVLYRQKVAEQKKRLIRPRKRGSAVHRRAF